MGPTELARFEELLLPHLDDAYALARYLVRDEHDAQDVVQDAYLRALRHFATLRGGDGRAWLLAIVRNCARSARRGRRAEAATTEFDEELHSGEGAGGGGDAEAGLRRAEAQARLSRALDRLPDEFREAIVLRELQGLTYREIAEVTGCPIGTVMSRLARGRQKLLEALEPGAKEAG